MQECCRAMTAQSGRDTNPPNQPSIDQDGHETGSAVVLAPKNPVCIVACCAMISPVEEDS